MSVNVYLDIMSEGKKIAPINVAIIILIFSSFFLIKCESIDCVYFEIVYFFYMANGKKESSKLNVWNFSHQVFEVNEKSVCIDNVYAL